MIQQIRRLGLLLFVLLISASPSVAQTSVATGVSDEATEANSQPKIARDAGTVYITFVKPVGGFDQIFVASSRDDGRTWQVRQMTTRAVHSRYPTLAAGPDGKLHLAWTQYEPIGHVYYARADAGRWTAPVKISPGNDYAGIPAIAVDPRGEAHVVWYGIRPQAPQMRTRHGSIYEILYAGTAAGRWSIPIVISPGVPDAINPALAADTQGRLHSAWYQFDSRAYQVKYAQRTDRWQRPDQITSGGTDAFAVALAVGRDTVPYVVWEHRAAEGVQIAIAERRGRWTAPQIISLPGQAAANPTIAVDERNRVYVAWESNGQLYLRRRERGWLGVDRITAEGRNAHPILAARGETVDLMWTQESGGQRGLRFVTLASGAARPKSAGATIAVVVLVLLLALVAWQWQRRGGLLRA